MKATFLIFTLVGCLIVAMSTFSQEPEKKVENAQEGVNKAQQDLKKAQEEYRSEYEKFKLKTDNKIFDNKK